MPNTVFERKKAKIVMNLQCFILRNRLLTVVNYDLSRKFSKFFIKN